MTTTRERGFVIDDTVVLAAMIGKRNGALILVAIVALVTTTLCLINPVTGLVNGAATWNLPVLPGVAITVVAVGCVAQAAALLLGVRRPALGVLATLACYLMVVIVVAVPNWLEAMQLVVAAALFIVASRSPFRITATWFAVAATATILTLLIWVVLAAAAPAQAIAGFVLQNGLRFAALLAGGAALGMWWQVNARRAAEVKRHVDEMRAEEAIRLQEALAQERVRVAQELHDVAGQHLAALMAHADNARHLTKERPERALEHIDGIRQEGRFATASVYAALSELRGPRDGSARTPGLLSLERLIATWTRNEARITVDSNVPLDQLPPVLSTTAYRGVQESLTNAAKHAPGAAVRIWIRHVRDFLLVVVENDPPPHASTPTGESIGLGWGLTALRDRLRLLAGDVEAGPTEKGGWSVRMTVPFQETTIEPRTE